MACQKWADLIERPKVSCRNWAVKSEQLKVGGQKWAHEIGRSKMGSLKWAPKIEGSKIIIKDESSLQAFLYTKCPSAYNRKWSISRICS